MKISKKCIISITKHFFIDGQKYLKLYPFKYLYFEILRDKMRLFEVFFNTVYIFRTLLRDFSFFFCQFECRIFWHLKVKRNSLGRKSYSLLNDFYFWDYSDCVIEEMPWIRLLLPLFRPKSIVIQHWINSQGAPFKVGKRSSVYIFLLCCLKY